MTELHGLTPKSILDAETPLFFTTASADRIRTHLSASRYWSDIAVFEWTPQDGMWRVTPQAAAVPGTRSALSGLGYVASVRTDSIFLFRDMESLLQSQGLQMALLGALTLRSQARRRVILPVDDAHIPLDLRQIGTDLSTWLFGTTATPHLALVREST